MAISILKKNLHQNYKKEVLYKNMYVIYSKEVVNDISTIFAYIAKHSRTSAKKVILTIYHVSEKLAEFPYMGTVVDGKIRRLVSTKYNYYIYYIIDKKDNRVRLLRIVHSKQNFSIS